MQRTILQIMPADEWRVEYDATEQTAACSYPLVCWALVETLRDDGVMVREVVGMTSNDNGEIVTVDDEYFIGYCRSGSACGSVE